MTDRALTLVMDCGQAMLANGGEVFRAQETMRIMAHSLGVADFHVYVLTNGIFASAKGGSVSAVRHVPSISINLRRVEAINAISRRVADGALSLSSAELEFRRAASAPPFSPVLICLASCIGAGCDAVLFGGGAAEMLCGALAGLLEAILSAVLIRHGVSRVFRDILASMAGTMLALTADLLYPPLSVNFTIIGALMVLTPGVSMTMGIRDIINGDYLSGTIRLVDALLVAGCLAVGVTLGYTVMNALGVMI